MFQFRFGSIESIDQAGSMMRRDVFQFRFGSIERIEVINFGYNSWKFQFRFGSIERFFRVHFLTVQRSFNSALVRLRENRSPLLGERGRRFNSALVRLRVLDRSFEDYQTLVSIPLWFDWEAQSILSATRASLFQFRFGSIESKVGQLPDRKQSCFNSALVRLRVSVPE